MNRRVYDLCMVLGIVQIAAGVALTLGIGAALVAAGGLLILLTLYGVRIS